jgi:hypothetical protein
MTTTKAMSNKVVATSKATVPNEPLGAYPQRTAPNPSQTNTNAGFKPPSSTAAERDVVGRVAPLMTPITSISEAK